MSAFVVSKTHIDALVTAGLRMAYRPFGPLQWQMPGSDEARYLTSDTASAVGGMLWAENMASVSGRYNEPRDDDLPGSYTFEALMGTPDPVHVLSAIACYRYQACEHPEWRDSEARAFCTALQQLAIRRLPGYDAAPWEITDRSLWLVHTGGR